MRRTISLSAALGAAALAAACGAADPPAAAPARAAAKQADAPLPAGRIAFRRYFDDAHTHGAIFTIDSAGSGEKQITRPAAGVVDDHPDWSPDGTRIAFERCGGPKPCAVYTVAATGGRAHKVRVRCRLEPICDATAPAWTPDGRLVVGMAEGRVKLHRGTDQIQQYSLVLVDERGGRQRTILTRTGWSGDLATPGVSPDGRSVVYMRWNSWLSKPALGKALYVVGIDGSGHRRVTPWELAAGDHPVFSPDGTTIVFRSNTDVEGKQSDYWTVHPDGSGLTRLTHVKPGSQVWSTSYSPDGAWIVHATDGVSGNADIYAMRADGTGNRPIMRTKLWESAPDWGPPAG
jgi:TolB protein